MPDKVWFATTNWSNKQRPSSGYFSPLEKQAEWDAYNSSKFNGFPFPILEKDEKNRPFRAWNRRSFYLHTTPRGKTLFIPSDGENDINEFRTSKQITVLSFSYTWKFTYDQLFQLFWRMHKSDVYAHTRYNEFNLSTPVNAEPHSFRYAKYNFAPGSVHVPVPHGGWSDCGTVEPSGRGIANSNFQKDNESELVTNLTTNSWGVDLAPEIFEDYYEVEAYFEIDFTLPVIKTGPNEYRPFVHCPIACNPYNGLCINATRMPRDYHWPTRAIVSNRLQLQDLPETITIFAPGCGSVTLNRQSGTLPGGGSVSNTGMNPDGDNCRAFPTEISTSGTGNTQYIYSGPAFSELIGYGSQKCQQRIPNCPQSSTRQLYIVADAIASCNEDSEAYPKSSIDWGFKLVELETITSPPCTSEGECSGVTVGSQYYTTYALGRALIESEPGNSFQGFYKSTPVTNRSSFSVSGLYNGTLSKEPVITNTSLYAYRAFWSGLCTTTLEEEGEEVEVEVLVRLSQSLITGRWYVNYIYGKNGFNNTPVGTYGENGIITIS